jgi:hypothetical protein
MFEALLETWNKNLKGYKVLMAHTCNPSYSRGSDQEDHDSKPAQADSLWDHILKKNPS